MVLLFVGFTIRYLYEYRKYLLDIYYIQNISMCRNTEKKCMHYENGIKDEKNIWKNLSLTWHNQGRIEGREEGRKEGERIGEERLANLLMKLSKQNRQEDSIKALEDLEYRKKLYEEFGV